MSDMEPIDYLKRDVSDLRGVVGKLARDVEALKTATRFVVEETLCMSCGSDYDQPFISLREIPHTCPLCIGLRFAKERRIPPGAVTRRMGEIWDNDRIH